MRQRPDALLAVCGDFNAGERDMALRILAAGHEDAEQSGLPGEELAAMEERIPADRRYSVLHGGRRLLPDHILASGNLAQACVGARIFNNGLDDEVSAPQPVVQSLHAPIVADFLLPD